MFFLLFAVVAAAKYLKFSEWATAFNRNYSVEERVYRETIYNQNLITVINHNRGAHSFWLTMNKFADLTLAEFSRYLGYRPRAHTVLNTVFLRATPPVSVDWRAKGAVTPVKNQVPCGSCWTFSATGSTESAWYLANGTLVSLSEQQLIDCGTASGTANDAFEYIVENGITSESNYPYTATVGRCRQVTPMVRIRGFKNVPTGSEIALMSAIAQQPVSVVVDASQYFQLYGGGVMTGFCGSSLNHAVLAVGYGTLDGLDYYIVKNSWGIDWGQEGYILLGRGPTFGKKGQCGIQLDPSYPVV
jgi:hypothetical protein